jgi:hypothetical protein
MTRRKCSICTHPEAMAINSALEAGLKQLEISQQFFVSRYAVSRHKNRCLVTTPVPAGEFSNSAEALAKWMQRCDETYLAASVNSDVRSAVAALSAAVRSLQFSVKQEEKEREQSTKNDVLANGEHPTTIERLDRAVRTYLETLEPH